MLKLSLKPLYTHLLVWLFLTSYIAFSYTVDGSLISKIVYPLIYVLNFIISYYLLTLFIFPVFYENRKILFCLNYLIVIGTFILIDYLHIKMILPNLGGYRYSVDYSLPEFLKNSLLNFSFITFTSTGAYFNSKSIERAKESAEKEKTILSRELYFLSDQFHSHLTFNFMNFCYSHLVQVSPKAANSFENFSAMLHYSLNKAIGGYVLLGNEIEYIKHFIEVQKCISKSVFVDFNYQGEIYQSYILKGVFSVFIENAFKHGIFSDEKNPIMIYISIENNILHFSSKNKKDVRNISMSSGIGLKNITQVLDLFYHQSHELKIDNSDYIYSVELKLKLKPI